MKRISKAVFLIVRQIVKWVYPKTEVEGLEHLPAGPCVIVGNHAQMHGPIIAEIFLPQPHVIWCTSEMMTMKEVPAYAYRDFWSGKPKRVRWLFRIASYLIAPVAAGVFNGGECIAVYRDTRVFSTFRETLARLDEGARIVIFPEELVPENGILWRFQRGFVDLARMYHNRTGSELSFVPMYVAPNLKKAVLGEAVRYDSASPKAEERERICSELSEAITRMARGLPEHIVVPYPNIPKDAYPKNNV